jgi:hypothetical protein
MDQASRGAPLAWIAVDKESFSGRMLERPQRPSIPIAAQEQLVVELYSKYGATPVAPPAVIVGRWHIIRRGRGRAILN